MHIFLNLSNDAAFGHLSGLADGVVDGLGVGGAVDPFTALCCHCFDNRF